MPISHLRRSNPTVLLVEDDAVTRHALAVKFAREHFRVLEARDGRDGLAVALREHPDAILLDLAMPVMDGIAMLEALRTDAWGRTAKVIILTNLAADARFAEAVAAGTYDYLVKANWELDDIVQRVRERIAPSRVP